MGPVGALRLAATGLDPKKGQALSSLKKSKEAFGRRWPGLQNLKYRYGAAQASGLPLGKAQCLEERGRGESWEDTRVEGEQQAQLGIARTSSVPGGENPGMSGPGMSPGLP